MLTGDAHEGDLRIRRDFVAGLLTTVEEIAVEARSTSYHEEIQGGGA
jgi:hypothetical protein